MPGHATRRRNAKMHEGYYPSDQNADATDALMELQALHGNQHTLQQLGLFAPPSPAWQAASPSSPANRSVTTTARSKPAPVPADLSPVVLPDMDQFLSGLQSDWPEPAPELPEIDRPITKRPLTNAEIGGDGIERAADGGFRLGGHHLSSVEDGMPKSGTFGSVSPARDAQGRGIMLKTPTKDGSREDLLHEAAVYTQIGPHENIVGYHGITKTEDGKTALALEEMDNSTVRIKLGGLDVARRQHKITDEEYWAAVRHIARSMIAGLKVLHDAGLVHSDIKGENVLVNKSGDVKIADMGTVRKNGLAEDIGTDGYKPPEMMMHEENHDQRGRDVYALGVTLGGEYRVDGEYISSQKGAVERAKESYAAIDFGKPPVTSPNPSLDTEQEKFEDLVKGCTSTDPRVRLTLDQAAKHPFLVPRSGNTERDYDKDEVKGRDVLCNAFNMQR